MSKSDREVVVNLSKLLSTTISYDREEMYRKSAWGSSLNLDDYKEDFDRVFSLARIVKDLPFYLLPDAQINSIHTEFHAAASHFQTIDQFDSSTANNSQQQLSTMGNQVGGLADKVTMAVAPWVSYLAYQKGDIAKNIEELSGAVGKAEKILTNAKKHVELQKGEISSILQNAQDIAGDKGVSVFTTQFENQATDYADEAATWLKVTGVIFGITVLALIGNAVTFSSQISFLEWLSRAALIGVLITAGIWSGNIYRTLRHQQSMNTHKANGLKSFLLFRDAADNDEATRNAVLMETTKSIFSGYKSGFIKEDGENKDQSVSVVDATKVLGTARAKTATE